MHMNAEFLFLRLLATLPVASRMIYASTCRSWRDTIFSSAVDALLWSQEVRPVLLIQKCANHYRYFRSAPMMVPVFVWYAMSVLPKQAKRMEKKVFTGRGYALSCVRVAGFSHFHYYRALQVRLCMPPY